MDIDQDDDSDSGISQVYHPSLNNNSFSLPDIAKTELASRLAAASPTHPANIKARILWKYNAVERSDLQAEKGEIVLLLYRENSKVYAVNNKGKGGFIPFNYCTVLRKNDFVTSFPRSEITSSVKWPARVHSHDFHKAWSHQSRASCIPTSVVHFPGGNVSTSSVQRSRSEEALFRNHVQKSRTAKMSSSLEDLSDDNRTTSMVSDLIHWDRKAPETFRRRQKVQVTHFRKFENEAVMVLFDFHAADENDVDVRRGEVVTVLNRDDEDWWWVMRDDGIEGFIPSSYVSIEAIRISSGSSPGKLNLVFVVVVSFVLFVCFCLGGGGWGWERYSHKRGKDGIRISFSYRRKQCMASIFCAVSLYMKVTIFMTDFNPK